jgi:surface antigen-like variable number repeat protein
MLQNAVRMSHVMIIAVLLLATLTVPWCASAQNQTRQTCGQTATKQTPWLREANNQRYTLRRIEFTGNVTISDDDLRRRVVLREGDLFSRRNLAKTLISLNRLGTLYPLTMRNVVVRMDRTEKTIDMTFCIRERHSTQGTPANNSLDRSGGGVFRIKRAAAKVE